MEIIALTLVLLSVISMAGHSVIRKWLFNNNAITESEVLMSQSAIATVLCGIWFLALTGWWENLAPLKESAPIFMIAIFGTTIANIVIQFANTRATRLADLSFTSPISAMTPGFVVLTAAVFGELPSTMGYVGIVLIMVGAYAHAREGAGWKEYLQPLFIWGLFGKIDSLPEDERNRRHALRWAYGGALCATAGLTFDGLVARHGNMALGVTIELLGLTLVFALLQQGQQKKKLELLLRERVKQYWPQMLGMGVCFGLPFVFLGIAFRLAPIAYVGSLKRLSIPLTLILAMWVLGEMKTSRRRLVTGSIITAGAVILAFDPTPAVLVDNLDGYLSRIIGR